MNSKPQAESFKFNVMNSKPEVRTEVILQEVYYHYVNVHPYKGVFPPSKRENRVERQVLKAIMTFIKDKNIYAQHIAWFSWRLFTNDDELFEKHFSRLNCSLFNQEELWYQFWSDLFVDFSNRLFQHGILWYKVFIYFIFLGGLARTFVQYVKNMKCWDTLGNIHTICNMVRFQSFKTLYAIFKKYTLEKLEPWMKKNWEKLIEMYEMYGNRCLFDELQNSEFWKNQLSCESQPQINYSWDMYHRIIKGRFCAQDIYYVFQMMFMDISRDFQSVKNSECLVCNTVLKKNSQRHIYTVRYWPDEYASCHMCNNDLKMLPVITVSEENVECSVCLEYFSVGDNAKCLPCKHLYHTKCIKPWIEKESSCPNCRRSVDFTNMRYYD